MQGLCRIRPKEKKPEERLSINEMSAKIIDFFKKEAVLCIALFLAVVSSFVILPDKEYLGYIDFHTLAILFCLMSVMAGLQKLGVFGVIAGKLLGKVNGVRPLCMILVLLCFFFSMFITNDVALITFVPFAFTVLGLLGEEKQRALTIPVVVLQTVAANLGSMLTPIGNPQNLYLYGKSGISLGSFLALMLPYTVISLVLLLVCCLCVGGNRKSAAGGDSQAAGDLQVSLPEQQGLGGSPLTLAAYLALFVLCLLSVAHVLSVWVVFAVVLVVQVLLDKSVLKKVDYSLLLTFVGFFVFIGNMGRVPAFSAFLQNIIEGNEVITAVVSSQAISNVPAALLLSCFTENYSALIIGTNLGGLGTLIASMASLISYKYISKESDKGVIGTKGKYMAVFTLANVAFLAVLLGTYFVIA